jgi:hypothetical protein
LVDLTFTEQGWTALRIQWSGRDPALWCAIGMSAGLVLGCLAMVAGLDSLVRVLLIVAGVLGVAGAILVGIDFVGTLFWAEVVAADRVVAARVVPDPRGTAVELRLDDGSTRRYLRKRAGLVEPFQRLLGERLSHSA